ncbi:MAG: sugar O-acetyltransferase [Lachnospiraceae bacterium]|nr:sugar O-acetyltransferase [Lachnospiraceae bacterium]
MTNNEIIEIMKSPKGYNNNNLSIPREIGMPAKKLCWEYNQLAPDDSDKKREILQKLLGTCHDLTFINPSFQCDYGFNIHTHGLTIINYNCVILDTSPVNIGANAFIVPGVCLSCAGHSLDAGQRAMAISTSEPITLEDDVWIGANTVVCGGVTIGKGSVIGAGSVVNKDIPAGVVAAGVPCRVIRPVTEADRIPVEEISF